MTTNQPADDRKSDEVPTGGRKGTRGGRWTSEDRFASRAGTSKDDPGNSWDNAVRTIEDALTAAD